jgi:predicted RNA-binding Zn ribbon-like protein
VNDEGRSWPRDTGSRDPAPEGLRRVQAFVNTNDIEEGRDDLAAPELLRAWLSRRDLISADAVVGAQEHRRAIQVREAIRSLAMANNGSPQDPSAIETLNRVPEDGAVRVRFDSAGGAVLAPQASGVDGALSRIVSEVYGAMVDGSWARMKACRRDICRWLFFDHSRNHSGTWCSMAVCGNRTKTAAYHRRRRDRGHATERLDVPG